ncbi:MAG: T9SS type A sorting domain-containing protein [Parvicellaceae bacterium]
MKRHITKISVFIAAFLFGFQVNYAQCPNTNNQFGTSNAPTSVGTLTTLSTCMYGGEYRLVNGLQAGSIYSFETCGDTDFDTQITVYDNTNGSLVAYNDDFCGLQSKVQFTSNGNSVRVLINRYFCTNQSSCMTLKATRVSGAPAVNPCNSVQNLTCGSVGTYNLSGSGAWNPPGPWGTPGEEQVYSFTPTVSGSHQIAVANQGFYVDLFVKAGSCSSTGWTYLDDIFSSATNFVNLTAGVTYYFLIDDENTSTSTGAIQITCPQPVSDPCNSVTNLTCGSTSNYSLGAGVGAWNPPGPWGTPGNEAVYSYTPTVSGDHEIVVTNNNFYVDLFVQAGSCGPTGWTYLDDIFSTSTNTVTLTAGVTYYFLIDDENTTASSGTFSIGCPCIAPPGGIDGSYTYSGPFTISSTTVGACNDCNLRSSKDRVYEINIPCAGLYRFTTCNGASWDTYLYLRTAPCGGSSIALNDDACGLQSQIDAQLQPGTYYIHVEGFSSASQGAFNLNVLGVLDTPVIGVISGPEEVCENETNVEFSVTGDFDNFTWDVPSDAVIVSGDGTNGIIVDFGSNSGNVSVVATNSCGVNSTSTGIQVNLNPIANAGSDEIVYYGYTPSSCATLLGSASGGTPSYDYSWSTGDNSSSTTVCPQTSSSYTLTVTDSKGCTSSDDVNVCSVDVICYSGNSGNQKVEMCQIPPGNPANAHTICISPNAVPAHLAIGCTLGACGEVDATCNSFNTAMVKPDETNNFNKIGNNIYSDQDNVKLFPNPANSLVNINFEFEIDENVFIEFYDMLGKKLDEIPVKNFIGLNNVIHNVSDYERGNYFYKISIGNNILSKNLNITR